LGSECTTKDAQRDPRGLSVAAALERCAELGALQSGRRNPGGLRESDLEHQRLHLKKKALHAELRHYDGHDYMPEKLLALEKLFAVPNGKPRAATAKLPSPPIRKSTG